VPHTAPEVVCIGETMAMVAPLEPGPLESAPTLAVHAGGAESTVAMYLAGLGHRAGWVSRVGQDPLGRRVLREIAAAGADTSMVEVDATAPTGVYFKDPRPQGTTVYYYRRGSAASLMTESLLEPVLEQAPRLVHATGITPALSAGCDRMISWLLARARAVGTAISFDINYRPALWGVAEASRRLLELARQADVVFVGLDEARLLWGCETAEEFHRTVGPGPVAVVRDGAVGATVFEGEASEFVPPPAVTVLEPVGAGDAFAAGWLSGYLRGLPHWQRLRLGHLVASASLTSTADHQPLPPWPRLELLVQAGDREWRAAASLLRGPA